MVISLVKEACRRVFLTHSVRIVEPMYLCDMYVSAQALGKVLGVLGKRRAQIVNQEMREGSSDDFAITAYLPVFESFGFALEMRDQTSGAANAQLVFSHWAVIDSDPFFKPTTQEELEEWGDSVDTLPPPLSKRIITDVRKRKGLIVQEKLVERADAQRNLSRKK
jgi:ribosome assembly protein 1